MRSGAYFVAWNHHWGLILAPEYTTADGEPEVEGLRDLTVQQTRVDLLLAYRQTWDLSRGMRLEVAPHIGARFRNLRALADFEDEAHLDAKRTETWLEPNLGGQAEWWLSNRISLGGLVDVSGFVVGDAPDLEWSATAMARIHFAQEFSLAVGYRWRNVEYTSDRLTVDGENGGVWIGIRMDWRGLDAPRPVHPSREDGLLDDPTRYVTKGLMDVPEDADPDDYTVQRWLSRNHAKWNNRFSRWTAKADTVMTSSDGVLLPRERAEIYFGLDMKVEEADEGVEFELKPRIRTRLDLPNLKERIKLVFTDKSVTDTPGIDRFDEEDGFTLGLEGQGLFLKETRTRIGVRSSSKNLAEFEGRISYEPYYRHNQWRFSPNITGYYRSDLGFGVHGFIAFQYLMRDRFRAVYIPAIHHNEELVSPQYTHNVAALYLFEGSEKDLHRIFATRFSVLGDFDAGVLNYRVQPLVYRAPLYGKWLYYTLAPQIHWRRITGWEADPSIEVFIEALFWSTEER